MAKYSLKFPQIEFENKETIKKFQEQKLAETLKYLIHKSPFYKRMFEKEKINVAKIKTISDLSHVPFTEKADLQLHNSDFLCVNRNKIVDFITTSGTLSAPVIFAMTEKDLKRLAYNEYISFLCSGISSKDVVQIMTTLDKRFMAGLAYFLGLRRLGAGIVRVGNGIPALQWDTINRINPNAVVCVPSFLLNIIKYAEENGIDYRKSSIRKAICIGENLRQPDFELNLLGTQIKEKWDISLLSTYASTEMATTFAECSEGKGGHHHPELLICEVIKDDKAIKNGIGELVITHLGVEGMPLLRFKTGDLLTIIDEPCHCGRNSARVSPVIARANHLLKYKGTTIYPPALQDVLDNTSFVENYVVIVSLNSSGNDDVKVRIGLTKAANMQDSYTLIKELKDHFRARIRVAPQIEIVETDEIHQINYPEMSRKPVKFIDNRA